MSLPTTLLDRVATELQAGVAEAGVGHCLRVDHLSRDDGERLCRLVRERADGDMLQAFVLGNESAPNELTLLPERAIEIRNRKQTRLCLFVPAGTSDAAASSLQNSFAEFDLNRSLAAVARELLNELPGDIRAAAITVREQLRGPAGVSNERWADYLGTLVDAPTFESLGRELWRVHLIPDAGAGEEVVERLSENRRCVLALVRPAAAQASLGERVESTGLRASGVRDAVLDYLAAVRLREARAWLRPLVEDPHWKRITFEQWVFEQGEQPDLVAIEIEPLLEVDGTIRKYTGLTQPGGPGSQPVAGVGPKRKVTVKWHADPTSPATVARWKAELIPAREEYSPEEAAEADLPSATAAARVRRGSVPLDIDLESTPIRAVQVRVVALDEHGAELRTEENHELIEGLSGEFWLEADTGGGDVDGSGTSRRETVPTLPFGRVKTALAIAAATIAEAPGQWNEGDLHYFEVTLNGRHTNRLALSPILRHLEHARVERDAEGSFGARVDAGEQLDIEHVEFTEAGALASNELHDKIRSRRRDVFRQLRSQEHRGLVETADWTPELARSVRSYANAFRDALSSGPARDVLADLLNLDTFRLSLDHPHGTEQAVLILPTHPLRLLWYSAYADLLRDWEGSILSSGQQRSKLLDLDLLERVAPVNMPAFVPSGRNSVFLFAQNLAFFWGLLLPVDARDPARRVSDVARVVGLPEDETMLADLPPKRLADEFDAYRQIHPYLETLRLNVLNPGSGAFLVAALRELTKQRDDGEDFQAESERPLRLEVIAHAHEPLPLQLPALERFQRQLYESRSSGRFSHLAPLCSLALRPVSQSRNLPGGEVNLSIAFDTSNPRVDTPRGDVDQDSASFYGLLTRLSSTFEATEGAARWEHRAGLKPADQRERHPVSGAYTTELVAGHRAFLEAIPRLDGSTDEARMPAIVAELSPDDRTVLDALHEASDWVVFLDRFFGVDFFDYPQNVDLARVSRRYLLDYAPEFLEGLGHRMLVTTSHREEITEILGRAMHDLGFGLVEESVGEVLDHLKKISGRLALRVIGDDARAREAVSLGVVAAFLKAQGELQDSILIPVDSHHEIFGLKARRNQGTPRARCDLVRVRFQRGPLLVTFIEVKSRGAAGHSEELSNRIVDQIEATEEVFRELFFRKDPPRLDHVLQRSRLATILRFYLQRAWRHGLISGEERLRELEQAIARLESGIPEMRTERWGFVVNLTAHAEKPVKVRNTVIRLITAEELASAGILVSESSDASPPASTETADVSAREAPAGSLTTSGPMVPGRADAKQEAQSGDESEAAEAGSAIEPRESEQDANSAGDAGGQGGEATTASPGDHGPSAEREPRTAVAGTDDEPLTAAGLEPTKGRRQQIAVELGASALDQQAICWQPSVRGSPHLFTLGIPGQGKSWAVTRILMELHRQGLSSLVFDFHGQFADPSNQYAQVAAPTVLDASNGLPFSPFEAEAGSQTGPSFWRTNAFVVAEIFEYVCGLGDIQRDVVYEAVRDSYVELGFDQGNPTRLPTVSEVAARMSALERERGVRNVVPRCRPLLEFGLFSDEYDAGTSDTFRSLIGRSAVLDVSRQGLEELQLAAGAFVLRMVYKEMFHWGETDRLKLVLVLDEAHRLARDITLPKIMKEGRKFGVAVVVASQGLADFHPDVVGNAGTKVIFRTNFPMSKKVAGFLRAPKGVDLAADIEQLEVGEAYVQTPEMGHYARVRMHPLEGAGAEA